MNEKPETRKEYMKAYRQKNKEKVAKQKKNYYEAKLKHQNEAKLKHQKEHPEQYLNVLGTKVYTNGMTKQLEEQLPKIIDDKIKEMIYEAKEEENG